MMELELRQQLAQIEDEIAEVLDQIANVPDNWPTGQFVSRLNYLEGRGLKLEKKRCRILERIAELEALSPR